MEQRLSHVTSGLPSDKLVSNVQLGMTTAEAQARYPLTQGVNPWLVTVSVMLPTFMEVLDTAIASVALPYIAGSLSSTNSEATWVLTSYLVANAVILPASNWFARRFGRKRFLLTCVVVFTVASFFCGAAPSLAVILLARVLQGAGGGALQPLSQSILLESFPPAKRSMAMAAYGLGIVVAPVLGPTLGGWLTDTFSWRYAFYINLPVGVLALTMIARFVHDTSSMPRLAPSTTSASASSSFGPAAFKLFWTRGRKTTGSALSGCAALWSHSLFLSFSGSGARGATRVASSTCTCSRTATSAPAAF